jgi:hypothetical protein
MRNVLMNLYTDLSKLLSLPSDFHILLYSFIFCHINSCVILTFRVPFVQVWFIHHIQFLRFHFYSLL